MNILSSSPLKGNRSAAQHIFIDDISGSVLMSSPYLEGWEGKERRVWGVCAVPVVVKSSFVKPVQHQPHLELPGPGLLCQQSGIPGLWIQGSSEANRATHTPSSSRLPSPSIWQRPVWLFQVIPITVFCENCWSCPATQSSCILSDTSECGKLYFIAL